MALSSLTSLKTLDLRSNPKLKKIPKEIAALRCLETLLLDETAITYPTPSIVCQGTEAIMRFLCQGEFFTRILSFILSSKVKVPFIQCDIMVTV